MDGEMMKAGVLLLGIMLTAIGVLAIFVLAAEARRLSRHNWPMVLAAVFVGGVGILLVIHVLKN